MHFEAPKSAAEQYIEAARSAIDVRIKRSPDAVAELFNIIVVERAEDRPVDEDCHQYVFGQPGSRELYEELLETHRQINIFQEQRQPGDIVLYCDDEGVVHVGKICSNGKDVVSKWGPDGHVYQHPPLIVPNAFGSRISILRPHAKNGQ